MNNSRNLCFNGSPVEEHDDEKGEEVVPGDVCLRVEGDEDEDAEGGREDEHGHVPREGGVPVRQRPHPGHELQVFHLEKETAVMAGVSTAFNNLCSTRSYPQSRISLQPLGADHATISL